MEIKNNKKDYKKLLFTLVEDDRRIVYKLNDSGIILIQSRFGNDKYKKNYNRFVNSYRVKPNFITIFREKFNQIQANLYVRERNFFQNLISKVFTYVPEIYSNGNFLDVGCNTGNFLQSLPTGWSRYGVEISVDAYQEALKSKKIKVFNTSLENFNTDIKFDFIRVSHVIEHIVEYDLFLNKMYQIMNHGSYALIYTPNTNSLSYILFKKYWEGFYEKTHVSLFNVKNLVGLCEKYNFKVVRKGTYFMGFTAGSIIRFLQIDSQRGFGKLMFYFLCFILFPFSLLINKFNLGGALYLYIKKN